MSVPELTIWAQSLDGYWHPLGSDVGVDVIPESWTHERLELGGPSTASFTLRRYTRINYADLGVFTPIYAEIGGVGVWSGRIARTPKQRGTDSLWDVQCEGWYAHCADDLTGKMFVHKGGGRWVDMAGLTSNSTFQSGCVVTVGENGYISMAVPAGNTLATSTRGAVLFDAGPGNVIERFTVTYIAGGVANMGFYARSESTIGGADQSITIDATPIATISTTFTSSTSSPRRYLRLEAIGDGGAVTGGATAWLKITNVQVFASAAYESGNASILVASDIVSDVLSEKCPLISTDTSLIDATSTVIEDYAPEGVRTPRDEIETVMLFDSSQFFLRPAAIPVPTLRERPERAVWVYDASTDGGSFSDGGANDGQEMYSQALVTYDDSTGVAVAETITTESAAADFTNGTFDVNATGWNAGTDTSIARDTSPVYAGAGSLEITATGAVAGVYIDTSDFTDALLVGRTYTITLVARATQATSYVIFELTNGAGSIDHIDAESWDPPAVGAWRTYTITFVAKASDLVFRMYWVDDTTYAASSVGHIDSCVMTLAGDTLIERRGFKRTMELSGEVASSTTATALADNFLSTAQYPPFKGTIDLVGYVRKYDTDEYIPVSQLPEGDLLLVHDETNPATGGTGRAGIVSRGAYTHNVLTNVVDLDSREDIIDQVMTATKK